MTPGKGNGKRNGNNKKRKATKISPLTSLYLDNFSKADLRRWIKISADLKQFHYQFYYSLQALRTTHYDELCGALRMSSSAVSDEVTNLAIKLGMREPIRTVKSSDQLHASLLADDWRKLPAQFDIPSNTQVFGKILADSGFEGVLYPSAKENKFKCLALFPQNFKNTESYIQLSGNIAVRASWFCVGCTKVSPGSKHCYAERMASRLIAVALANSFSIIPFWINPVVGRHRASYS